MICSIKKLTTRDVSIHDFVKNVSEYLPKTVRKNQLGMIFVGNQDTAIMNLKRPWM